MQRIFAPGKSRRGLYRTVAPGEAPAAKCKNATRAQKGWHASPLLPV